jgi:uncharacterized protein YprB with RNaseH-like and TPR domain
MTNEAAEYVNFSIGFFDIEASSLNGSFGRILSCACAHAMEGDVWVARCDDPPWLIPKRRADDSRLVRAIRDHLLEHDILVSWNGKRAALSSGRLAGFDIPMLNARLAVASPKERVFSRSIKHIDLLRESRRYLQLHSHRLGAVGEFLELQEEKTAILPRYWNRALSGDREAMDYIVDHNVRDVRLLRLVFEEFRRAGILERPAW